MVDVKKLYSFVAGIVLFALVSIASAAIPTELIEKARDATILVGAEGDNGGGGFGTGVIIDPSGLAITNYHVIHRAKQIRIFFWDPEDLNNYTAEIIGIDPVADLALLQIKVKEDMLPLTYLNIESENFIIGEEVVAIGHMLGLQWSVTQGTINHTERPGKITPYVSVLQHSAQINKGNSGGALINKNGDIVGINTYILLPKGGWSGIAYAIRGDNVYDSVQQINETGEVQYTAFKIGLRNMNEFFIKAVQKEYPEEKIPTNVFGLMAIGLEEGDHASEQGIKEFDVLIAVDGRPVNHLYGLKNIIQEYSPGDIVKVLLIRDSHIISLDYELGSIDFTDYEEFYDKSIKEQFEDKPEMPPVPEEKEEKPKVTPLPEEEQVIPIPIPQPIPQVPHLEEDDADGRGS